MRNPYHISMSGGYELICRSEEDYARLFNCIALAAYEADSVLLADAEMSSHVHLGVRTDEPYEFISRAWLMYTHYFNNKYRRHGHLGEKVPFVLELDGLYHIIAAICYILRNPLHHGLSPTPCGYPFSSVNTYFRKELGKWQDEDPLPVKSYYRHLLRLFSYPEGYRMSKSGVYMRETVIGVAEVENMFVTPRAFMYYMNRLSGEEWKTEQEKDKSSHSPITLDLIERGIGLQTIDGCCRTKMAVPATRLCLISNCVESLISRSFLLPADDLYMKLLRQNSQMSYVTSAKPIRSVNLRHAGALQQSVADVDGDAKLSRMSVDCAENFFIFVVLNVRWLCHN